MSRRSLLVCFITCLALLPVACADDSGSSDTDASGRLDAGADRGPSGKEQGVNKEQGTTPDLPEADLPQSTTCDAGKLGTTCTTDADCGKNGVCLETNKNTAQKAAKFCTCKCTPDNPQTSIVNEDDCPGRGDTPGKYRCGTVSVPGMKAGNYCLRVCAPKLGGSDCPTGVACNTLSEYYGGVPGLTLCVMGACSGGLDCPVNMGTKCSPLLQNCKQGEMCVPLSLGNLLAGRCYGQGECDAKSGLCKGNKGKAGVNVGDPCTGDHECGPSQMCLPEMDQQKDLNMKPAGATCKAATECCSGTCTGGKCGPGACRKMYRNGYCTIQGCKWSKTLTHTKCPTGSLCNEAFIGGMCQKSCQLAAKTGCRNHAKDYHGDYECRDWSQLTTTTGSIAPGPVCDFGHAFRCDTLKSNNIGCQAVGDKGNTTNMSCRDPDTGKTLTAFDPTGYCLDDTAAGPLPPATPDAGPSKPDAGPAKPDAAKPAADAGVD